MPMPNMETTFMETDTETTNVETPKAKADSRRVYCVAHARAVRRASLSLARSLARAALQLKNINL